MSQDTQTTKEDVATLLENFVDYENPDGKFDPWFTLNEINQQFAWVDIDSQTLFSWLDELEAEGKVQHVGEKWRWVQEITQ